MLRSCYSPPFDVIFRSTCQCCFEIKKSFQCSSILFWFIGHFPNVRWQHVPLVRPGHRKTALIESVSVGARHDQVAVVSRTTLTISSQQFMRHLRLDNEKVREQYEGKGKGVDLYSA